MRPCSALIVFKAAASGPSLVLGLAMMSLLMMDAYKLHTKTCHLSVR